MFVYKGALYAFHQKFRENCQQYEDSSIQNNISVKIDNETCNFLCCGFSTSGQAFSPKECC